MGLQFTRRKKLTPSTTLNVSKKGLSASKRVGPVTVNSRGKVGVRLGKGLRWKF